MTKIQPFLLYVLFDRRIDEPAQGLLGHDRVPDRRGRDCLMHVLQQMDRRPPQHQIAIGGLLGEGLAHGCGGRIFRQSIGHIRQRKSWTAGHDELTFAEKRLGLVPVSDIVERVDPDQEKKLDRFF